MPDYSTTSRDPYLRAKAVADAQLGPTPAWLLTGSVCLVTTLIALVLVGSVATDVTIRMVIIIASALVGLATLATD